MNKAFVREPEVDESRCPRCGSPGISVGPETLRAQLPAPVAATFLSSAYYCAYPGCPVAYFDRLGQTAPASQVRQATYPKSPDGVLCACTGVKANDLVGDFRAGNTTRIKDLVARSANRTARCALEAADGRPCAEEARRLWMRLRGDA